MRSTVVKQANKGRFEDALATQSANRLTTPTYRWSLLSTLLFLRFDASTSFNAISKLFCKHQQLGPVFGNAVGQSRRLLRYDLTSRRHTLFVYTTTTFAGSKARQIEHVYIPFCCSHGIRQPTFEQDELPGSTGVQSQSELAPIFLA